jgi:hypothetical protein
MRLQRRRVVVLCGVVLAVVDAVLAECFGDRIAQVVGHGCSGAVVSAGPSMARSVGHG